MSNDLVKRLKNPRPMSMFLTRADQASDWTELLKVAADRIEELEAKLAQQDDLVQAAVAAKLREAAGALFKWGDIYGDNAALCVLALIREEKK